MDPKYKVGQMVTIRPLKGQQTPKDADIMGYAGRMGKIVNYHWIQPNAGKVFYIYTVHIGEGLKDLVVHEDELTAY